MKKFFIAIVAIVLVAAACNNSSQNNQTSNTPTPSTTPTTQTYSNATYGFSFDYPSTMSFVTPTYANLQDKVVQAQIGQDQYPGTNFGDAAFAVSASFAKNLADCLSQNPPEGGDGFKTKVTMAGTDFYMTKSTGVGAGNIYDSTVYRTIRSTNGACLEINETIHTGNIGNYTPGTVTEVNKADVQSKLDSLLQTFKFTS